MAAFMQVAADVVNAMQMGDTGLWAVYWTPGKADVVVLPIDADPVEHYAVRDRPCSGFDVWLGLRKASHGLRGLYAHRMVNNLLVDNPDHAQAVAEFMKIPEYAALRLAIKAVTGIRKHEHWSGNGA